MSDYEERESIGPGKKDEEKPPNIDPPCELQLGCVGFSLGD